MGAARDFPPPLVGEGQGGWFPLVLPVISLPPLWGRVRVGGPTIAARDFPPPLWGRVRVGGRTIAALIPSRTPSVSWRTSVSQNLSTRNPLAMSQAVRRLSCSTLPACWPPSTSITSPALKQAKSTTYGPIGTWRRKRRPSICSPRSRIHSLASASVILALSRRAF